MDGLSSNLEYLLEIPDQHGVTRVTGKRNTSKDFTGNAKATYTITTGGGGQPETPLVTTIETYDGNFLHGQRQGRGKYTYANGDVYQGGFDTNQRSGIGRMSFAASTPPGDDQKIITTPTKEANHPIHTEQMEISNNYLTLPPMSLNGYFGFYLDGKRQGPGVYWYKNGDVYSGQWKQGKRNGSGKYTFAKDNTMLDGEWIDGQFRNGKWHLEKELYFVGKFRGNKPNGTGIWVVGQQNQIEGQYEQKIESTTTTTEDRNVSMADEDLSNESDNDRRSIRVIGLRFVPKRNL